MVLFFRNVDLVTHSRGGAYPLWHDYAMLDFAAKVFHNRKRFHGNGTGGDIPFLLREQVCSSNVIAIILQLSLKVMVTRFSGHFLEIVTSMA